MCFSHRCCYGKSNKIFTQKLIFNSFLLQRQLFFNGKTEVSAETREKFNQTLQHLENFLNKKSYFAGNKPTLADISILSNITYLKSAFGGIGNLPNLEAWYKRCDNLPGYQENVNSAKFIGQLLEQMGIKLAPL